MKLNAILILLPLLLALGRAVADETNAPSSYEKQMLKAILADADANKDNPELRKKYLNEFLTRSSTMNDLLNQTNIWILRAAAAIELDYPCAGWIAGKQLKRFGLQNSDNPAVTKVFMGLDRKNWLGEQPPLRDWSAWTLDQVKAAANTGDEEAQREMSWLYENGKNGLAKDLTEAFNWQCKAAAQGNASAQNSLGAMYATGEGVKKDLNKAQEWQLKAAAQGDEVAKLNIAMLKADVSRLRQKAEQGDAVAQYNLGLDYQSGLGVDKDWAQAVGWFRKAAEQGNADGQFMLGIMYSYGNGIAQDQVQAADWIRKAAEQGHTAAQHNMILDGLSTQNYTEALYWARINAAHDDAEGEYDLGWIYENGLGVDKDLVQAKVWYQKAAAQGNETAKKNLARLNQTSP